LITKHQILISWPSQNASWLLIRALFLKKKIPNKENVKSVYKSNNRRDIIDQSLVDSYVHCSMTWHLLSRIIANKIGPKICYRLKLALVIWSQSESPSIIKWAFNFCTNAPKVPLDPHGVQSPNLHVTIRAWEINSCF
jgi:hypothetical protein